MATTRQQTREIPQGQWGTYLDALSRDHRGDLVSVRFIDPDLGYQIEMRQLPLVGVSADLKAGGGPRISVTVGRTEFDHTTHSVFDPKAVRVQQDDLDEPLALELESGSGGTTLVILKPAAFGEPGPVVRAG